MMSLDTSVDGMETDELRVIPSRPITASSPYSSISFASFRDAFASWHRRADVLEWIHSNAYAVVLLSASNLRPHCFHLNEERAISSLEAVPITSPLQLVLHAPCCHYTTALSEEERLSLIRVPRVLQFLSSAAPTAAAGTTSTEVSATKPSFASELATQGERLQRVLQVLLTRAHQACCPWRDSADLQPGTPCAVRQLLLGGPSLSLKDSPTVRAFCGAVTLRNTTAMDASVRLRCLLPRGTPPSVVREWMKETLAALQTNAESSTMSEVTHGGVCVSVPPLRYVGSSVNDRILSLLFTPKKRQRSGADEDAGSPAGTVDADVVLSHLTLLMSLCGYAVTEYGDEQLAANPPHSVGKLCKKDASSGAASDVRVNPDETSAAQATVCSTSPPLSLSTDTAQQADERTRVETTTQSCQLSQQEAMRLLGRRVRCRFCAHEPCWTAVREDVTTTTTTILSYPSPLPKERSADVAPSSDTGDSTASAPASSRAEGRLEEAERTEKAPTYEKSADCARTSEPSKSLAAGTEENQAAPSSDAEKGVTVGANDASNGTAFENDFSQSQQSCSAADVASSLMVDEEAHEDVCEERGEASLDGCPCSAVEEAVARELTEGSERLASGGAASDESATSEEPPTTSLNAASYGAVLSTQRAKARSSTHTRKVSCSCTTVTLTFSCRNASHSSASDAFPNPHHGHAGHHPNCPWAQLFLCDVIDAVAAAAPERTMDFTWIVGEDVESTVAAPIQNVEPFETASSAREQRPALLCRADGTEQPDGINTSGSLNSETTVRLEEDVRASSEKMASCEVDSTTHRINLVIRFHFAEVERLITAWRLSEEWECNRPGEYQRHPLWRTWATSQVLHPVHSESADGVMEQYLRTLERRKVPSTEEPERRERAAENGSSPAAKLRKPVSEETHTVQNGLTPRAAADLSITIGAPLYRGMSAFAVSPLESSLHLSTAAIERCFEADDPSTSVRSGSAEVTARECVTTTRALLQATLHALKHERGLSDATVIQGGGTAGLHPSSVGEEDEELRRQPDRGSTDVILSLLEKRYADRTGKSDVAFSTKLRRAVFQDALPRALRELTAQHDIPLQEAPPGVAATVQTPPAWRGTTAEHSLSSSHKPTEAAHSLVTQFVEGMRKVALDEQLQLQRAGEEKARRAEDVKLASASAAGVKTASSGAPAAASPPPLHANSAAVRVGGTGVPPPHIQVGRSAQNGQQPPPPHRHKLPNANAPHKGISIGTSALRPVGNESDGRGGGSSSQFSRDNSSGHRPTSSQIPRGGYGKGSSAPPPVCPPLEWAPVGSGGGAGQSFPPTNPFDTSQGGYFYSPPVDNTVPGAFLANSGGSRNGGLIENNVGPFNGAHPFGWSPLPSGPSGVEETEPVTVESLLRSMDVGVLSMGGPVQSNVWPPNARGSASFASTGDSILGNIDTGYVAHSSASEADDVRLSNWSGGSPSFGSGVPGSGGGVLDQSFLGAPEREYRGMGAREGGPASSKSIFSAPAPPFAGAPQVPSTTKPSRPSRGGGTVGTSSPRGRGAGGGWSSTPPVSVHVQGPVKVKANTHSVLGGGGAGAHGASSGGRGGGSNRGGHSRGRGGGPWRGGGRGGGVSRRGGA